MWYLGSGQTESGMAWQPAWLFCPNKKIGKAPNFHHQICGILTDFSIFLGISDSCNLTLPSGNLTLLWKKIASFTGYIHKWAIFHSHVGTSILDSWNSHETADSIQLLCWSIGEYVYLYLWMKPCNVDKYNDNDYIIIIKVGGSYDIMII